MESASPEEATHYWLVSAVYPFSSISHRGEPLSNEPVDGAPGCVGVIFAFDTYEAALGFAKGRYSVARMEKR